MPALCMMGLETGFRRCLLNALIQPIIPAWCSARLGARDNANIFGMECVAGQPKGDMGGEMLGRSVLVSISKVSMPSGSRIGSVPGVSLEWHMGPGPCLGTE